MDNDALFEAVMAGSVIILALSVVVLLLLLLASALWSLSPVVCIAFFTLWVGFIGEIYRRNR